MEEGNAAPRETVSSSEELSSPTYSNEDTVVSETDNGDDDATLSGPGTPVSSDQHSRNGLSARVANDAPIFWTRYGRTVSNASYRSVEQHRPGAISLEDHSEEDHELSLSCWAQCATVDEFVVVSGATGIGAYVVWHCTVKTLKGGGIGLRKRYSEFDQLRADLVRSFPHAEAMIPQLPRKSIVSRFRPWFLEQRQAGLAHFLNCILLNPEFAASPILKDFIFS